MEHESFDLDRNFRAWSANHLIQIGTSERGARIIWFRSELQSMERESFDSDRNFRAWSANHLIQIGTSERGARIIWFRSELQSVEHESFDLDRNFGAWSTNHLIQIGTSERGARIIWFRSELRSVERGARIIWFRSELRSVEHESFDSDRNLQIFEYWSEMMVRESLIRSGGSQIIWFRSELWSGFVNLLIQIGTSNIFKRKKSPLQYLLHHLFKHVTDIAYIGYLFHFGSPVCWILSWYQPWINQSVLTWCCW